MYCKLIACDVFLRELCHCLLNTPHTVDLEFTEKGSHDQSDRLQTMIQEKIDRAEEEGKKYDAILLAYGLCGNSTAEIAARSTRVVIPRAHDCCTLFLGSKLLFKEHFSDNPSRAFSSAGYMERGDEYLRDGSDFAKMMGLDKTYEDYVAEYGEENAQYIMETLQPVLNRDNDELIYIEVPETERLGYKEKCREEALRANRGFRTLKGNLRLLKALVEGDWTEEEFLVLEPGQKIVPVYDWEEILRAGVDGQGFR